MSNGMQRVIGIVAALAMAGGLAQAETGLGRHKKVYAVPTPGKVVIDGTLDDWDLSGQIEMFVMSETKEMQSAKFALMYDAEALYVGAEVRDPSPLMNRQDPKVKGEFGWDADACQVRLVVDPALGYPINLSTFEQATAANPQVVHLILWNYTDREEACLQMVTGMNSAMPRPEWAPFGVVPAEFFQAKYLKAADGRGSTFEYRIPWKTLNASKPLKGGDLVAGTVQFNWGQPDGLKTAGGSAWCYDVLAGPGFPFQSTACWGKILFSATGNLPKSLVEEGLPPELPLPLTFGYLVPEESEVSVALFDEEGTVVKTLVAQGQRRAGENVERWDGFAADGKPLPAGEYTWKGLSHKPITTKYVMSLHNSGQPGYQTDAPSSAWGADHGSPTTVYAPDDGMLLAWSVCELGWAIIKTDLNGKKIWGSKESAKFLTVDGGRFFAAGGHGFQDSHGVKVFDLKDGRPLNFGSGNPELAAPAGGEPSTNEITGLACGNGVVYVAHGKRNLIALHDATQGTPNGTIEVPNPGAIAVRPDGSLAVVSGKTVVAVKDGKVTPLATDHLDSPSGIAVAADGSIFVANGGGLQNVSIFGADGKYLRSIGKAGGRPRVGRYDREGMLEPGGIAVAKDGRLWVAETLDFPKRHSVWNADGGCADEFFGAAGYFGWSWMDPEHPDEAYCNNVLWKIDLDKGTWTPHSTIWRPTKPDMISSPTADGYAGHFRVWTAKNGRQYGWGMIDYSPMLFLREGDIFKPVAGSIRVAFGAFGGGLLYPSMKDIYEKTKAGSFLWQDANDDQCVQEEELVTSPTGRGETAFNWIDRDFNAWSDAGFILRPVRFEADGRPVYDFEKREPIPFKGSNSNATSLWLDEERGDVYTLSDGVFGRWTKDGKPVWSYRGIVPWNQALGLPLVKPGLLHGLTMPLGVAGDFTGAATYFNPYHIFTRDGVYVAMLTRDGRDGKGFDWNLISSETIQGQLVKPKGMDRYFLLSGAGDGRILEVLGLDTVKPLAGGTYVHSEEEVAAAIKARQEYDRAMARSRSLEILRGKPALAAAPAAGKRVDEARAFTARGAYDAENLYLQYEVTSPAPMVNAATDHRLLFKSGNCLDLQLAADPAADPDRKTPAPGDVRVLITRQAEADGKTFKTVAVVYRPKVKDFKGEPFVFTSPTGKEAFDVIETTDRVGLEYKPTPTGFTAVATVPLEVLGLRLEPGRRLAMDLGYLFGNAAGSQTAARAYWCNNGFAANVTYDVPNESRLEPAEWGAATVE